MTALQVTVTNPDGSLPFATDGWSEALIASTFVQAFDDDLQVDATVTQQSGPYGRCTTEQELAAARQLPQTAVWHIDVDVEPAAAIQLVHQVMADWGMAATVEQVQPL